MLKHNVEHLVMKLFDKETSSCLLVIIGHFDTFIDETLKENWPNWPWNPKDKILQILMKIRLYVPF